MKKAKKVLLLVLCAVLLVGASVAGTVAYLTSQDEVVNTFTVGQVDIELHETNEETRENGTVGLNLHLLPGIPVDKDPTVTVLKDSEDCYVRVKVTVDVSDSWTPEAAKAAGWMTDGQDVADAFRSWADTFAGNYFATGNVVGFNTVNWNVADPVADSDAKTITYILTYLDSTTGNIVKKSTTNTELTPIFDHVQVPQKLTNAQLALLAGMEIKVEAHAIQAEGFVEADGRTAEENAWMAFDG